MCFRHVWGERLAAKTQTLHGDQRSCQGAKLAARDNYMMISGESKKTAVTSGSRNTNGITQVNFPGRPFQHVLVSLAASARGSFVPAITIQSSRHRCFE